MADVKNIIERYQQSLPKFDFDKEQKREFTSLKDLYKANGEDATYDIEAIFINKKSKFGDAPVFYIDGYMVNIPQHQTEEVKQMIQDEEFVNAINQRQIGFKPYEFENKQGQTGYSYELVETDNAF